MSELLEASAEDTRCVPLPGWRVAVLPAEHGKAVTQRKQLPRGGHLLSSYQNQTK